MPKELFYTCLVFKEYTFTVVVSQFGLVYLSLHGESPEHLTEYFAKKGQKVKLKENKAVTAPYIQELTEYFAGTRQDFNLPLDYLDQGTAFQQAVWQGLLQIPYGQSWSYSQLAQEIQRPKAIRAVGSAVGKNPLSIVVPCHRILHQDGGIGGYGGGLPLKKEFLALEGIPWREAVRRE